MSSDAFFFFPISVLKRHVNAVECRAAFCLGLKMVMERLSIASSILPPGPPPFLPLGTIKNRLAELNVDIVVRIA